MMGVEKGTLNPLPSSDMIAYGERRESGIDAR
jgi:hypothetical protein